MASSSLDPALRRRIQELQQRCEYQQKIIHTDFWDAQTVAQIQAHLSFLGGTAYTFSGGYPAAERQVLFFLPDWQNPDLFQPETCLSLLRIRPAAAKGLSHRDYLGSLMALGMKREKLGDILVLENYADLIALPAVVPYLTTNLTRVGATSAEVTEISFDEFVLPPREITIQTRTVASLRCDSMIAAAFSLSRAAAVEAITQGLVFVNHFPEEKPDRSLPPGCLLSLRGQGRVRIETDQKLSRKGRIFIRIIREK